MEITFRGVPDFDRYRCGDDGSVWSLRVGGTWKQIRSRPNRRGQHRVVLRRDGRGHDFMLGRLILITFVGPCPEGMECLHWNDDPSDNRLSNLRWGTSKENSADALRNRRYTQIGTAHHSAKLTEGDVAEIRSLRATGMGPVEIARRFGIVHQHVSKICGRKCWKEIA